MVLCSLKTSPTNSGTYDTIDLRTMDQSAQGVTVNKEHESASERQLTQAEQTQVREVLKHLSQVEMKAPEGLSAQEIREHVLAHEVPEVPPELAGHMTPLGHAATPDIAPFLAPAEIPARERLKRLGRLSASNAGRWFYEWCIRILKVMHVVRRRKA